MARFLDKSAAVRNAREAAEKSLRNGKLRSPSLGGVHFEPRTLMETLEQEFIRRMDDDINVPAEGAGVRASRRGYDPEREARETRDLDDSARKWALAPKLDEILTALTVLADKKIRALSKGKLEEIKNVLKEAPGFITRELIHYTSEHVVDTRKNWLQDSEKITREINAALYPKLDDPESAEFTMDDHKNTQEMLRYMHERASVLDLAAGNLLTIVNKVNEAFAGRGRTRS